MEARINIVLNKMAPFLNSKQLKHLSTVLRVVLSDDALFQRDSDNEAILASYLTARRVEGCSPKTIEYYRNTLVMMNGVLDKPYAQVTSDDLRKYLHDYEVQRHTSKVTIDNIRRIMSSFFSWLENEDYIVKSPVRRIHRVKTATAAKEVFNDEELEVIRRSCSNKRDRAVIDMLASTGMRIGELVKLDRNDINFKERECVVTGKGNKQRPVYFDARAKQSLISYLDSRSDTDPALFMGLCGTKRASIGAIEGRMRDMGKKIDVGRIHPHKFRRTLATHAIDKGMPIEQVQKLLGHAKIDTTMCYAMVNQNNVKASHRKYLE